VRLMTTPAGLKFKCSARPITTITYDFNASQRINRSATSPNAGLAIG
jgi:hypothetical protein